MKVLPVGSVVKARGIKLLIVGYQMFYRENRVNIGYLAAKYPRGYAGKESLGILQFTEIQDVLKEGLHTPEELRYTEGLRIFHEHAEGLDGEKWRLFMESLDEGLKKEKRSRE